MITEFLCFLAAMLAVIILRKDGKDWHYWSTFCRTREIQKSKKLQHALSELSSKEGDIMIINLYGRPTVVLSSFGSMKIVLGNPILAKDRPCHEELLQSGATMGITWGYGSHWRHLKTHSKQLLRKSCDKSHIDDLVLSEVNKIVQKQSSEFTKLDLNIYDSCNRIICDILGGSQDSTKENEIQNVLSRHGFHCTKSNNCTDWYTIPNWLIPEHRTIPLQSCMEDLRNFVQKRAFSSSTRKEGKVSDGGFIDAFLQHYSDNDNLNTTVEHLAGIVSDVCGSGTEPLSNAIKWILKLLAENPQVQTKVYEEINDEHQDTFNLAKNTTYRKATLFEVFRFGNVLPIPMPRCATETFSINGITVQKGYPIIYNLEAVFSDEIYWGRTVNRFLPERFLDCTGTKLVKTERMAMFGFGKRACLGESIVWNTLMTYMTVIFKNLELTAELCGGTNFDNLKLSDDRVIYARRR